MQRRSLLVLLATVIIASVVVGGVALSGTVYTWEKTFEVKKPEIECIIHIGDCKIVGCPANVWVCLKLEGCGHCCLLKFDDALKPYCECDWRNDCYDDCIDCCKCCCRVNGTYSVYLYWWNETSEEWEHVKHLQEEINITVTCCWCIHGYTFIPRWEGEYKVVVTFATDSEICTFTNED